MLMTLEQRRRWRIRALSRLVVLLALAITGRTAEAPPSSALALAEVSAAEILSEKEVGPIPPPQDPLYDEFLKEFKSLRGNQGRREQRQVVEARA